MKSTFTILTVFLFIFSFYSCSSDDNSDLQSQQGVKQEVETPKEEIKDDNEDPAGDFTSQEYVQSLVIGQWVSTEISLDGIDWIEGTDIKLNLSKSFDYILALKDKAFDGKYVVFPATEEDNVTVYLDNLLIIEIYSYENGIAEGFIDSFGTILYFKMEKQ